MCFMMAAEGLWEITGGRRMYHNVCVVGCMFVMYNNVCVLWWQLKVCERLLEEEGVYGQVSLANLPLDLIPLDRDILSLELPDFFNSYFMVRKPPVWSMNTLGAFSIINYTWLTCVLAWPSIVYRICTGGLNQH